jgi:hypothetical protein
MSGDTVIMSGAWHAGDSMVRLGDKDGHGTTCDMRRRAQGCGWACNLGACLRGQCNGQLCPRIEQPSLQLHLELAPLLALVSDLCHGSQARALLLLCCLQQGASGLCEALGRSALPQRCRDGQYVTHLVRMSAHLGDGQ